MLTKKMTKHPPISEVENVFIKTDTKRTLSTAKSLTDFANIVLVASRSLKFLKCPPKVTVPCKNLEGKEMQNEKLCRAIEEYLRSKHLIAWESQATYYDFPFNNDNLYVALRFPEHVDATNVRFRGIFLRFVAVAIDELNTTAESKDYGSHVLVSNTLTNLIIFEEDWPQFIDLLCRNINTTGYFA